MARRATRNAQQTIYRLYFGPLERNVRGRLFDSEGGGGAVKFCLTDNLFSAWARSGNLFSCGTGSGKNYFRVNMANHSPLRQLINTRNSNVIESSGIRWNY